MTPSPDSAIEAYLSALYPRRGRLSWDVPRSCILPSPLHLFLGPSILAPQLHCILVEVLV
jgi:hypothetical protein